MMQIDDFYALVIIVLGVVLTLFGIMFIMVHIPDNKSFALTFDIFTIWFFSHFGIRLINYLWQFEHLHKAIEIPDIEDSSSQTPAIATVLIPENKVFIGLEKRIEKWVEEKKYIEQGITIDVLARELRTNRNYLSHYINTLKNKSFRSWINELRIEEAKRLIISDPQKAMLDVAMEAGFVDRSNFFRQFSQQTGMTPKSWIKAQEKVK